MEKHKKRPKNGWRISLPRGLLIPCELFNRTTEAWTGTALCPRDRQVGPGWTKVAVTIATLCILMPYAIRQGNGFAVDSGGVMLRRWGLWCPTCRKDAKRGRFGKCGAVGPSITQHDAHSGFIESLIQISYGFVSLQPWTCSVCIFHLCSLGRTTWVHCQWPSVWNSADRDFELEQHIRCIR